MGVPVVYRSIEDIFTVLSDEKFKNLESVKQLLNIYDHQLSQYQKLKKSSGPVKHKFIVLEGLDGSGKSTISKILKERGFGVRWSTPPHDLLHLRAEFDSDPVLKTAFYALGNYIAAMQVSGVLRRHNVIMDRYWHSTAAFALGRAIKNDPNTYSMPPKRDTFYCWPGDLLKPDKVFFLHVSEGERLKRLSRRRVDTNEEMQLKEDVEFRQSITEAYKNMFNPGVEVIQADGTKEQCVQSILDQLK